MFWKNSLCLGLNAHSNNVVTLYLNRPLAELIKPTGVPAVLVTSSSYVPTYRALRCGLAFVRDDSKIAEFDTMFLRKGLSGFKKFTSEHRTIIRQEHKRLSAVLYPSKQCYHDELGQQLVNSPLQLPQLQYVFLLILVFGGAGGLTLVAMENIVRAIAPPLMPSTPTRNGTRDVALRELEKLKQILLATPEMTLVQVTQLIDIALADICESQHVTVSGIEPSEDINSATEPCNPPDISTPEKVAHPQLKLLLFDTDMSNDNR